jgi:fatty acid desaturase
MSLLRVRTFLEHRADQSVAGRTVVIEDTGFFAFLFLNNNYHLVHHMHPRVAWYQLPALYQSRREQFLALNNSYVYPNYWAVFVQYFFNRKDPVPHPLR